jgi:hypothetical protein
MDLKRTGLEPATSELVPVADSCEHDKESSGTIKDGDILDKLSNDQHLVSEMWV